MLKPPNKDLLLDSNLSMVSEIPLVGAALAAAGIRVAQEKGPAEKTAASVKKSYAVIMLLFMLYALSFSLVIPAIPGLVLELVHNNTSKSSYYFGGATAMRYLIEFFSSPVLGSLADVKGRKGILLVSFLTCSVEFFLLAFAPSIPMLFFARAVSGMGDVGASISYTIVTDIATHNTDVVSQKYALIGAMFGLAFTIGPICGGILSSVSFQLCLAVAGGVCLLGTLCCALFLEETLHLVPRDEQEEGAGGAEGETGGMWGVMSRAVSDCVEAIKRHLANKRMRELTIVLVLATLGGGYYFIWYLVMDYRYDATSVEIGLYLSFMGLLIVVVNGVLVNLIIPKVWNEIDATFYGLGLTAAHVLLLIFCVTQWSLYALSLIFCVQALFSPALKAVIVHEYLRQEGGNTGNLQGILQSITTLSTAVAAMLFAVLFSLSVSALKSTYLIFLVSGSLYGLATIYFSYLRPHLIPGAPGPEIKDDDALVLAAASGQMNPLASMASLSQGSARYKGSRGVQDEEDGEFGVSMSYKFEDD